MIIWVCSVHDSKLWISETYNVTAYQYLKILVLDILSRKICLQILSWKVTGITVQKRITTTWLFRFWVRMLRIVYNLGTSLVAQWLSICLPMQGTQVQALVREDPMCLGATNPVHHNYLACALEPVSHNCWAHVPQLLEPTRLELCSATKKSHRKEKPTHRNKE